MRRWVGLLVLVSTVIVVWTASAPSAAACETAPTFDVTLDHLAESAFNADDSRLARDYREWTGDDAAAIEVRGVYVYETIYTVEPDGDWSRGSVSVPVEIWGEWPSDTSPRAIVPEDRSGEPPDDCGWDAEGAALGTRTYTIVTSAERVEFRTFDQEPDAVLDAAFGAPDIAPSDAVAIDGLIAQIERTRNSSTGLLVAAGSAALLLAAVVYFFATRRRRRDEPG